MWRTRHLCSSTAVIAGAPEIYKGLFQTEQQTESVDRPSLSWVPLSLSTPDLTFEIEMRATRNGVDWPNSFTFLLLKPQFHTFFRSISSLQSSISSSLIVNLKISSISVYIFLCLSISFYIFYIFLYLLYLSIYYISFNIFYIFQYILYLSIYSIYLLYLLYRQSRSLPFSFTASEAPKPSSSGPSSRSWAPFSGNPGARLWGKTTRLELIYGYLW